MDSRSPEENSLLELLLNGKRFLIITGEVNSGKTSSVQRIILLLKSQGKRIVGVYAKGIFSDDKKTGFNIIDIQSGEIKQLASNKADENFNLNQGKYYFNPEIFKEYNAKLNESSESDVIIIDEVGPLELDKKGFFPSIENLVKNFSGKIILVVRKSLLGKVLSKLYLKTEEVDFLS